MKQKPSRPKKLLPRAAKPLGYECDWQITLSPQGHICLTLMQPGQEPYHARFLPEDGYSFAEEVLEKYDIANGILIQNYGRMPSI